MLKYNREVFGVTHYRRYLNGRSLRKKDESSSKSLVYAFFCKKNGSTIIEFALIAPLFLFVIIIIFELALVFLVQNALEASAREAARYSITGRQDGFSTRQEAITERIKSVATRYTGGIIDPNRLVIEVKSYGNLSQVNVPETFDDTNRNGRWDVGEPFDDTNGDGVWSPDSGVSGSFGLPGQVVLYVVKYTWRFSVPLPNMISTYTLQGQSPVENENF